MSADAQAAKTTTDTQAAETRTFFCAAGLRTKIKQVHQQGVSLMYRVDVHLPRHVLTWQMAAAPHVHGHGLDL